MWLVSCHAYFKSRQGKSPWIFIWQGLDYQPNTKNYLSIGALSVEGPMLLKWKWTNIWYFPPGTSNLIVDNVEKLFQKKIFISIQEIFLGNAIYLSIFWEINHKKMSCLKAISKGSNHYQNTLVIEKVNYNMDLYKENMYL